MCFKWQKSNRGWTLQTYRTKYNTAKGVEKSRAKILQNSTGHLCKDSKTVLSYCPYALTIAR